MAHSGHGAGHGAACANCEAQRTGAFCAGCGQRALEGRHTLRGFAKGAAARVFNLERGLVHTAVRLTLSPGRVVRDYLRGRTAPYIHPLAYLVLAFAAFALSARWLGATGGAGDRVFFAVAVFFLALASRLVFWRTGLNYAEHLILNTYLLGHLALILTLGQLLVAALPGALMVPAGIALLVAVVGYVVWGYAGVFRERPVLAAVGGLLALGLGILLWFLAMALLVQMHRSLQA